ETRFPPEPNGYLHIGHAKSICLNFGIANKYHGGSTSGSRRHLRFEDTNPTKEEVEFVESIKRDVQWLGFDWGQHLYYTSDYFDKLYEYAVELIKKGKAFVCHLNPNEVRGYRGTLTEPGKNSPYRDRLIEDNLELFEGMRRGEFEEGECSLRAKIDMSSPNLNMRDPVLYRIIKNQIHHRTLNLTYTVMSKRKLKELVTGGHVTGWDDPRMPTISGLRRRGYTPEAIRKFCEVIGVSKANSVVDIALLEHCLREDLNLRAPRVMAVLNPLRVVIDNYPEDKYEELDAENNPEDPDMGSRKITFGRVIYIEQNDFCEQPPKKFFRLSPGQEVRLKHAYYIKCAAVIKDEEGKVVEIHCTYDPETKGGWSKDGRRVLGTLHWVSAQRAIPAEVRLYSSLFVKPNPEEVEDLNPNSLIKCTALVEPHLAKAEIGNRYQFLRHGYFCVDIDSTPDMPVFNQTVALKDSWAKVAR
ncbi:glutamine--tRNA ligase, partial [Candidatus Desantisbacteria bacterium]|nr:glutamine--tRNA ligase [Candidatus Desantisbacteria bacterium]